MKKCLRTLPAVLAMVIGFCAQASNGHDSAFDKAISILTKENSTETEREDAIQAIKVLALNGDGKALNEMGAFYATGNIPEIPKDCKKAIEYFTKAWEHDEYQAAQNLAIIYRSGDCVAADTAKAYEWTRKGAEAGHAGAMRDLGLFYLEPKYGQEVDSISALGWFRRAAEAGDGDSMWQLSRFYHNKGNAEESRYWLKNGVDIDNLYCLHGYGLCLKNGSNGIPKDINAAAQCFKKSADLYGFEDSQMEYANYCLASNDYKTALDYVYGAAKQGNIYCIAIMGMMFEDGLGGLQKSDEQAYGWYCTGAETEPRNDEERSWFYRCFARKSLFLYLGRGVQQNKQEGRRLLHFLVNEFDDVTAKAYISQYNIQ